MTSEERFFKTLINQPCCGLGNVIVPPDVDRQTYIDRCFSTETISFLAQSGGLSFNNVPVTLDALQYIEFPEDSKGFGSVVVVVFHPKTNKPIVVGVLNKGTQLYGVKWKQFKQFKTYNGNYVSVVGDGNQGYLCVNVKGAAEGGGGKVFLSVEEPSSEGELKVSVQGNIQLIGQNLETSFLTCKIVGKEEVEVQTKVAKISASEKVTLGTENLEPVVLGDKLVSDVLKPLLSALKTTLKVATVVGPSGLPLPDFISKMVEIETKLDTILSKKVETE